MDNIQQYIDVLVQAPIAATLIVFIFLTFKLFTKIIEAYSNKIDKITNSLDEAIRIIKQQERK